MRVNEQDFKTKYLVPAIDYQRCLLTNIWKLKDKGAILSQEEGAFLSAMFRVPSHAEFEHVYSPASQSAPTSSEQLAIDAEMDGTAEGELKSEEKRKKDESWAKYTDENPRGAGNTMNRG